MLPRIDEDALKRIISQIESILFVSGDPVNLNQIQESLKLDNESFNQALSILFEKHQKEESGLQIIITNTTVQMVSKPENFGVVKDTLTIQKKRPLSRAAYEVLSIIAYSQPITRAEIENVRGVNSKSALQHLLDFGLVEEAGRKDALGNPYLYKTTELFLQMAKINNLTELPEFESFKEKIDLNE